jgi:hypothetical protein
MGRRNPVLFSSESACRADVKLRNHVTSRILYRAQKVKVYKNGVVKKIVINNFQWLSPAMTVTK